MPTENPPFDFDRIESWGPLLEAAIDDVVPNNVREVLNAAQPEYLEDARDILLQLVNRETLVDHVSTWIKARPVFGYHGTRVTEAERVSIQRDGLLPLVAASRAGRLKRSLSKHPDWPVVEKNFDAAIELYGAREFGGRREGQVHLTVSRAGLQHGFNYYLRQGSEFDWHVSRHLLGEEGQALVSSDGTPTLIKARVPGDVALAACNPYGKHSEDMPNLISDIVRVWAYWLAYPLYKSESLGLDCGMIFRDGVPSVWFEEIISLTIDDLGGDQ